MPGRMKTTMWLKRGVVGRRKRKEVGRGEKEGIVMQGWPVGILGVLEGDLVVEKGGRTYDAEKLREGGLCHCGSLQLSCIRLCVLFFSGVGVRRESTLKLGGERV